MERSISWAASWSVISIITIQVSADMALPRGKYGSRAIEIKSARRTTSRTPIYPQNSPSRPMIPVHSHIGLSLGLFIIRLKSFSTIISDQRSIFWILGVRFHVALLEFQFVLRFGAEDFFVNYEELRSFEFSFCEFVQHLMEASELLRILAFTYVFHRCIDDYEGR